MSAWFQSTRPRGARHTKRRVVDHPTCFNPRARAGRDGSSPGIMTITVSFNPRARAGRDMSSRTRLELLGCFNPRARAGRDKSHPIHRACKRVSIHAPARGATARRAHAVQLKAFQSTRPRGARLFVSNSLLIFIFPSISREVWFKRAFPYSVFKELFEIRN